MSNHRRNKEHGFNPFKLLVFLVFVVICSTFLSGLLTLASASNNPYMLGLVGVIILVYLASMSLW